MRLEPLSSLTPTESRQLRTIVEELSRPEAHGPKLAAVSYFLTEHRTEGKTWLEHGRIIFSQYYDTAGKTSCCASRHRHAFPPTIHFAAVHKNISATGLFMK